MPTDKRARQKAARQAKRMAQQRRAKRRKWLRNGAITLVGAGVVIGLVVLTQGGGSPSPSTTTTTVGSSNAAQQAAATRLAVAAGCPQDPKLAVNTLKWTSPPRLTIATSKRYSATIKTTAGTIVVALDAHTAPKTVNSFVFLAKHGYFHCVIFHRVIPGFVDQTGDPTGTGSGGPGYQIPNENVPKSYATGDVAMANAGANTNGSQFFFVAPGGAATLDGDLASGGYSLFGSVTSGMSVVDKINKEGTASGTPAVVQRILSVTIHEQSH